MPPLAVKVVVLPAQIFRLPEMEATGGAVTASANVLVSAHPLLIAIKVYVVLETGLTVMVDVLCPPGCQLYELAAEAVSVVLCPLHTVPAPLIVMFGAFTIVIVSVVLNAAQEPEAEIEYVTVYVPAVLNEGLIAPDAEFIFKPPPPEYVPPVVPVCVTLTTPVLEQIFVFAYVMAAENEEATVTIALSIAPLHPPEAGVVYVTV